MTITNNHINNSDYTRVHQILTDSISLRDLHLSSKCSRSDRRQVQHLAHKIANTLAGPLVADDASQLISALVPLAQRYGVKYLAPLMPVAAFAMSDHCFRACLDFGLPVDGLVMFALDEPKGYTDTLTLLWTLYDHNAEPTERERVIGLAALLLDAGGNSDQLESGMLWETGHQSVGEMMMDDFNNSEFLSRSKAAQEYRLLDEISMANFKGNPGSSSSSKNTVVRRV